MWKNGNSGRFYFLGLQNHCGWWLQAMKLRHLLLGRKAMTKLDTVLKSRDVKLPTKVHLVKAMIFPVVWFSHMYKCEIWIIKKAECWRIDAFQLWCWRRFLRIPWIARRSNKSIIKKINLNILWKDWCWSWSSSTLSTWLKELTLLKRPWYCERLRAGGEEDNRG